MSRKELDMKDLGVAKKIIGCEYSIGESHKISLDQCPKIDVEVEFMSNVPYTSVVGCLMYIMGTTSHGIMFRSGQSDPSVVGYVDSDYTSDIDDKRSTTRYVFTLVGGPICWKLSVHSIVAMTTIETEYMIVAEAAKKALWLS
ncbi:secreted RxLR effector protein 161-like [Cicer arietinum]|uniref:secreted RxLR effector protein 161-like n=1 Tax=Cicer arietinum TaxID=3827 RepID=UPI003CC5FD5E